MPVVTLPDGSRREFSNPVSVYDVANDIGPGLAKAALAGVVDGKDVVGARQALCEFDLAHADTLAEGEYGMTVIGTVTAN